ncbi:hypothetical protein BDZ88DRAFT_441693 [Geranomyces variabilis]|nr:hypothetical protein BDZ88DRAFT_441693 [Geranomyces variabilis]
MYLKDAPPRSPPPARPLSLSLSPKGTPPPARDQVLRRVRQEHQARMHPRGRNHRNKLAKLLCYQERSLAFLKVLKEEGLDFLYMVDTHRRRLRPATQGFEGKELVSAQLPLGQEDVMHAGKMLMSALRAIHTRRTGCIEALSSRSGVEVLRRSLGPELPPAATTMMMMPTAQFARYIEALSSRRAWRFVTKPWTSLHIKKKTCNQLAAQLRAAADTATPTVATDNDDDVDDDSPV